MTKIHEFMTGWNSQDNGFKPSVWSERTQERLLGTARSTRAIPNFRAFDMIGEPNQSVPLFHNDTQRIGVESVVGAQQHFTRCIDFDLLLLQFAGTSTIETEFGVYEMKPAELLHIPGGIAHRSTGSADCLRLWIRLNEPVETMYGDDKHRSHTELTLTRKGGPAWTIPAGAATAPKGAVVERMVSWYDRPDDRTEVERDYADLVGVATTKRGEKVSGIRKLRIFDVFWEITGAGRGPGPKIVGSRNFMMEVYNTRGQQHAFHRALRTDEFGIQFRGRATNMSEIEGSAPVLPGGFYLVPRGIAHCIRAEDDQFLRTVLYSEQPWRAAFDASRHVFDSRFETVTKVVKPADWWTTAAAE